MREDSVKNWKENRALACVVLAAAILGGTFGIGGAKLSSAARIRAEYRGGPSAARRRRAEYHRRG